jgi:hypothetical protein
VQGEGSRIIATIATDIALTVTQAFTTSVGGRTWQAYDWDLTYTYDYNPLKGGFGGSPNALGSYYRIRVTNIESAITTYFRLSAALCPFGTPLPNTVDEEGALPVCVQGLNDEFGNSGKFTPTQEAVSVQALKVVGAPFQASNNSRYYTLANNGAGSAATENLIATLTSGTAINGYGQITSVSLARWVTGEANFCRTLARLTALLVANNTRRWGAYTLSGQTPQDGFYFEHSGAGVLSVVSVKGGVPIPVASGAFNGNVNIYTCNTNAHVYDITYLGTKAQFYIDNILIHTITPTTAPMTNTLTLPTTAQSINSGIGTVSGTLELWTMAILRYGQAQASGKNAYFHGVTGATVLKIGPGRLKRVIINAYVLASTISIYDAVTAVNPIGLIVFTAAGNGYVMEPRTIEYDLEFYTGLCITVGNAATDVTFVYD